MIILLFIFVCIILLCVFIYFKFIKPLIDTGKDISNIFGTVPNIGDNVLSTVGDIGSTVDQVVGDIGSTVNTIVKDAGPLVNTGVNNIGITFDNIKAGKGKAPGLQCSENSECTTNNCDWPVQPCLATGMHGTKRCCKDVFTNVINTTTCVDNKVCW